MQRFSSIPCVALLATLVLATGPSSVDAQPDDRVGKLAQILTTAKSPKGRLSAAVQLGELRDKRALRPLIRALSDRDRAVRAVAAAALGRLEDPGALPALQKATRDPDKGVRRTALESIASIRKATSRDERNRKRRRAPRDKRLASYSISALESPVLTPTEPKVFVVLKSTTDESKDAAKPPLRRKREQRMRALMAGALRDSPRVTVNASQAQELSLSPYFIDLTIQDFKREESGPYVEIVCELRVAVSNERGKMLSVMTGGAKVQVPKRTFREQYESKLRLEALENAIQGMHHDVVSYLERKPS